MAKVIQGQGSTWEPASSEPKLVKDLLDGKLDEIEGQIKNPGVIGLETGYHELDRITYGLRPGHLAVIAGRPVMGKSILSMNFAERAALDTRGLPVVFFTLERTSEDLLTQMFASLSRVDVERVQTGDMNEDEWIRITSTIAMLNEVSTFYIDDSAKLTPTQISERSHTLAKEHGGIGLIVVDSLQLVTPDRRRDTPTAELSDITRSLKALAKVLKCPVLLTSQLNRYLEQRADKRPVLSDLRDSGSIEQDADLIMFIYRDELYHPDGKQQGLAELIVGKHTYGLPGSIYLRFAGKYSRFDSYVDPSLLEADERF